MPDTDGDGLTDLQEAQFGSDPNRVDSDNDGLTDLQEYQLHTNPTKNDTDGDGIYDGNEVSGSFKGVATDPTKADSDGDGWNDMVDFKPNDADTDHDGISDSVDDSIGSTDHTDHTWSDIERAVTAVATGGTSEIAHAVSNGQPTVLDQVFDALAAPVNSAVDAVHAVALAGSGDLSGARDTFFDSVTKATEGAVDINVDGAGNVTAELGAPVGAGVTITGGSGGVTVDESFGVKLDTNGDGERDSFGVGATQTVMSTDGHAAISAGGFAGSSKAEGDRYEAGVFVDLGKTGEAAGEASTGAYGESRTGSGVDHIEAGVGMTVDFKDGFTSTSTAGYDTTHNGDLTSGAEIGLSAGVTYDDKTGVVTGQTTVFEDSTAHGVTTTNEAGASASLDIGRDGTYGMGTSVFAESQTGDHEDRVEASTSATFTSGAGAATLSGVAGVAVTHDGTETFGASVGADAGLSKDPMTGQTIVQGGVEASTTLRGVMTTHEASGSQVLSGSAAPTLKDTLGQVRTAPPHDAALPKAASGMPPVHDAVPTSVPPPVHEVAPSVHEAAPVAALPVHEAAPAAVAPPVHEVAPAPVNEAAPPVHEVAPAPVNEAAPPVHEAVPAAVPPVHAAPPAPQHQPVATHHDTAPFQEPIPVAAHHVAPVQVEPPAALHHDDVTGMPVAPVAAHASPVAALSAHSAEPIHALTPIPEPELHHVVLGSAPEVVTGPVGLPMDSHLDPTAMDLPEHHDGGFLGGAVDTVEGAVGDVVDAVENLFD
jgi:hypothetical protein